MNSNTNPFQDPAVLNARSPNTAITLDPDQVNMAVPSSPAPAPSPAVYQQSNMAPTPNAQAPLGAPPSAKHQHNLMDEIGNSIKATNSSTILRLMRTINMILATATVVVGVLAWVFGKVSSFQKVIAGIYIIMFGLLLLAFELRTEKIDRIFRLNFGFMYGNKTRTIFLLFMAIWPLSMGNFWLTILDAVLLFINAFFNYFVISQHPAFTTIPAQMQPPQQPQQQYTALGHEIIEYCDYTQRVIANQQAAMEDAIWNISICVQSIWPEAMVTCFGSFATGLWLPSSDVDVVVMNIPHTFSDSSPDKRPFVRGIDELEQIAAQVRQQPWVKRIEVVASAKVPVAKLVLAEGDLRVDISIENMHTQLGIEASALVRDYITAIPVLHPLIMVLKQLLREKGLNNAFTGGLSSYCIALMAFYLWLCIPSRRGAPGL
ncbi:hypothetical protein ATCC90586_006284 [Pythium insidiosum]|nr:hypothetical protein ATCC90586_006284 [Pythium insidiosum]